MKSEAFLLSATFLDSKRSMDRPCVSPTSRIYWQCRCGESFKLLICCMRYCYAYSPFILSALCNSQLHKVASVHVHVKANFMQSAGQGTSCVRCPWDHVQQEQQLQHVLHSAQYLLTCCPPLFCSHAYSYSKLSKSAWHVMQELTTDELCQVLVTPKNALSRQYAKQFNMSQTQLHMTGKATQAIATIAKDKGTGARGLRSIMERLLMDAMFEVGRDDIHLLTLAA